MTIDHDGILAGFFMWYNGNLNDGFLSSCAGQDAMAWVSLDRVTFSRRPKNVLNVSINVIQPSMVERIDVSEGLG